MSVVSDHTLIAYVRAWACTDAVRTGWLGAGCPDPLAEGGPADPVRLGAAAVEPAAEDGAAFGAGTVARVPVPVFVVEHAARAASTATTATIR